MTELAPKIADKKPTSPLHYYHNLKWRLLAEAPWLVIALALCGFMLLRLTLLMGDQASVERVVRPLTSNLTILGFLVLPVIITLASGDLDLSVGFLAGAVSCLAASLGESLGLWPAVLLSLPVALGAGLINALLVGLLRLKGVIVTFAMGVFLYGLTFVVNGAQLVHAPKGLDQALSRSPFVVAMWILLALGCAALMIFTPFGRRPRIGEPQESLGRNLLYRGLPFLFSSGMAWVAGILLLSYVGAAMPAAGSGYVELALLAALAGGTAYQAGTGFALSGAFGLAAVILFQNGNQMANMPIGNQRLLLGVLLLVLLPITHYYHVGVDWLYRRQKKKAGEPAPASD